MEVIVKPFLCAVVGLVRAVVQISILFDLLKRYERWQVRRDGM